MEVYKPLAAKPSQSHGEHREAVDDWVDEPAAPEITEAMMSHLTVDVEHKTLLAYLSAQRDHALGILEGLDEEALRRPVLPSGWSCLGLVQHLALDIERFWFRAVVIGEPAAIDELAGAPDAWQASAEMAAESVFELYR